MLYNITSPAPQHLCCRLGNLGKRVPVFFCFQHYYLELLRATVILGLRETIMKPYLFLFTAGFSVIGMLRCSLAGAVQ